MVLLRERVLVALSVVLLGLGLSLAIDLPTWMVTLPAWGSPVTLYVSAPWVMGLILLLVTTAAVESLLRFHPLAASKGWSYRTTLWGLPALIVLLATFLLNFLSPSGPAVVVALLATGFVLGAVLWSQYHTTDPQDPYFPLARQVLRVLVYGLALLLYTVLYGLKVRSLLSATAVSILSAFLAAELLREAPTRQAWGYGLVIGLALGELTWALNYWAIGALPGGPILLLAFYLLSGIAREGLRGRLSRRVVLEFVVVAALSFGVLLLAFPPNW